MHSELNEEIPWYEKSRLPDQFVKFDLRFQNKALIQNIKIIVFDLVKMLWDRVKKY